MNANDLFNRPQKGKLVKSLFTLLILLIATISSSAQEVKWTKELPGDILWQEVTVLGNLIVSTDTQLIGVDPGTGNIIWSKPEHAKIELYAYSELANSPFFTVTKDNSIHLIDQLTGKEVFNS